LLANISPPWQFPLMKDKDALHNRLYFQPALFETARIVGYRGIASSKFWEKANTLGIPTAKIQAAVDELTKAELRQQSEPRYELTPEARKLCWQLLGPEPGHPDFKRMGRKPEAEEAGHAAKVKKPRTRHR
jgi:hypothetical protein